MVAKKDVHIGLRARLTNILKPLVFPFLDGNREGWSREHVSRLCEDLFELLRICPMNEHRYRFFEMTFEEQLLIRYFENPFPRPGDPGYRPRKEMESLALNKLKDELLHGLRNADQSWIEAATNLSLLLTKDQLTESDVSSLRYQVQQIETRQFAEYIETVFDPYFPSLNLRDFCTNILTPLLLEKVLECHFALEKSGLNSWRISKKCANPRCGILFSGYGGPKTKRFCSDRCKSSNQHQGRNLTDWAKKARQYRTAKL